MTGLSVGDVRALLAKGGVPHTPRTHYLLIADAPGTFSLFGCCDDITSSMQLLNAAAGALGQECGPEAADSPFVVVSRNDLRAILSESVVPEDVRDRLCAAARAGTS